MAPLHFVWKLADFAATLKKGAHVQVEGELRAREYESDGIKHRVFECRLESILKLDRAERRGRTNLRPRELMSEEGYLPPQVSVPPSPRRKHSGRWFGAGPSHTQLRLKRFTDKFVL